MSKTDKDIQNLELITNNVIHEIIVNGNKYITLMAPCQAGKTDLTIKIISELIRHFNRIGYSVDDKLFPQAYSNSLQRKGNRKIHFIGAFCMAMDISVDKLRQKFRDYNTFIFNDDGEPIAAYDNLASQIYHFANKNNCKIKNTNTDDVYIIMSDEDHLTKSVDSRFSSFQKNLGFDVSKPCSEWDKNNVIFISVSATDIEGMNQNVSKSVYIRPGEKYRHKHQTISIDNFIENDNLSDDLKQEISKWIYDRIDIGGTVVVRVPENKKFKKDVKKHMNNFISTIQMEIYRKYSKYTAISHHDFHNKNNNLSKYISEIESYTRGKFKIVTIYNAGGASDSIKCNGPVLWCCMRQQGTSIVQSCGRMNGYPPSGDGWNDLTLDRTLVVTHEGSEHLKEYNRWIDEMNSKFDNRDYNTILPIKISSQYTELSQSSSYIHEILVFDSKPTVNDVNNKLMSVYPKEFANGFNLKSIAWHKVGENKNYDLVQQLNDNKFLSQYAEGSGFKFIHVDQEYSTDKYGKIKSTLTNKNLNRKYIVCVPFKISEEKITVKPNLKN